MNEFFIGGQTTEGTCGLIVKVSKDGLVHSYRTATEQDGFDEGLLFVPRNPKVGENWFDYSNEFCKALGAIGDANASTPHLFPQFILKKLNELEPGVVKVDISMDALHILQKLTNLALTSKHLAAPPNRIVNEMRNMSEPMLSQMLEDITRTIKLNS